MTESKQKQTHNKTGAAHPTRRKETEVLTDKQKQEILDEAFEQVKAGVIENAIHHVDWNIKSELAKRTNELVKNWVTEELGPELITSLDENKSVLIEAAIISAEKMAETLASAMAGQMVENLSSSYKRNEILKSLFG